MSIYSQFQSSVAAADQLVSMYGELRKHRGLGARGRLDAGNTDLLWLPRSAVVACLSALDSYVHAVLYDRIPSVMRQHPVPEPLCDMLASVMPVKNGTSFSKVLPILRSHDSVAELGNRLKEETLSFLSYQAPEKIIAAYKLIGYPAIFDNVADIWPGPRTASDDIKRTLANYAKRRNQIAHEGDREAGGEPRPMQPKYASDCREFTVNLVSKLNRVVYGI